jgi:hypothetical protein
MFRRSRQVQSRAIALGVDRDQTAFEHYSIAIWLAASATLFAYELLSRVFIAPAAAALAVPASTVFLQALICSPALTPPPMRWRNHIELISRVSLLTLLATAVWLAGQSGWIRFVAWSFIAVVLGNAVAAAIAWPLRHRFEACLAEVSSP